MWAYGVYECRPLIVLIFIFFFRLFICVVGWLCNGVCYLVYVCLMLIVCLLGVCYFMLVLYIACGFRYDC